MWSKTREVLLILDANNGLGQVAMHRAVEMGVAKAKENGVAVVGRSQLQPLRRLRVLYGNGGQNGHDLVCVHQCDSSDGPLGRHRPLHRHQPLVLWLSPTKGAPLVLDMATTSYARGKVFIAARKGEPIPEGVALDKEGAPTTDAKAALEGIMLPASGPKGFGLSLIIDLLWRAS